jgi:hypothetical protein
MPPVRQFNPHRRFSFSRGIELASSARRIFSALLRQAANKAADTALLMVTG